MNYPTLKIEYLRDSKDSVLFDGVQRGEIATSTQEQSQSNTNTKHSNFEDNYNTRTDCIFC